VSGLELLLLVCAGLGGFFAADIQASSALTRELLGWQPTHPGLIDDLDQGHYFEGS